MGPGLALPGDRAHVLLPLGGEGAAVSDHDLRRIGDRKGVFLHSYPSLVPVRSRVASTVSSPSNPGVTGIAPARGLRQAPAWLRPRDRPTVRPAVRSGPSFLIARAPRSRPLDSSSPFPPVKPQ